MPNVNFEFEPAKCPIIARDVIKEVNELYERYPMLDTTHKAEYEQELLQNKIATLMYQLIDLTNSIDTKTIVKGMLEGTNRIHRTLQNQFFSDVLIVFMREYTNQDRRYFDGRNEIIPEVFKRMLAGI